MPIRFGIFLYDDVEPIDLGATYGVLSMARRVIPDIEIVSIARIGGEVRLSNGLCVLAEHGFDECPPLDVLMVMGGAGWRSQAADARTLDFLRTRAGNCLLVSVCTGALILAAAGLLDGRRATTRRRAAPGETAPPLALLAHRHPQVHAEEAALIDAGDVVTGGGVTLAIDTTLYLLERLFGPVRAAEIAGLIDYSAAREANRAAFAAQAS